MLRRLLTHRWALPILAVLGMLLASPILKSGLLADDYIHWGIMMHPERPPQTGSIYGLFSFIESRGGIRNEMKVIGEVPWWSADNVQIAFWRPLSELSHGIDYAVANPSPFLMHLHNHLWYGLLILMLGRFYRLMSDTREEANLATLLFAIGGLHAFVIGWIAARNQLISACLSVLAMELYHRWRTGQGQVFGLGAYVATVAGLMAAEGGIVTMGYLGAYALTMDNGPLLRRLLRLLPYAITVVVWRVVYQHLGYGTHGSPGYIDPGADTGRFLVELIQRLPALMTSFFYGVTSSVMVYLPGWGKISYALLSVLAIWWVYRVSDRLGVWASPRARFYALGGVLALVPVCASPPHDRLLIHAEIGLGGLVAMLFEIARQRQAAAPLGRDIRWTINGLKGVHFIWFPVLMVSSAVLIVGMTIGMPKEEALALPNATEGAGERFVLLHAPTPMLVGYYHPTRRYFGMRNPESINTIGRGGNEALDYTVEDEHTLKVISPVGFIDWMSRDIQHDPFHVGQEVDLGHMKFTVLTISDNGTPMSIRVHFTQPLTDPTWKFFIWNDKTNSYGPFVMPPVGTHFVLSKIDMTALSSRRLKAAWQ